MFEQLSLTNLVVILAAVAAFLPWAVWRAWRDNNSYIGFGWVLDLDQNGEVRVVSRLLKSPAGEAGIYIGDTILSYNGVPLQFASGPDHRKFWKERLFFLKVEEKVLFRIKRREEMFDVEMEARIIYGPIPVYDPLPPIPTEERYLYNQGLAFCRRTGQWFETRRLSNEALDKIFG